MWNWLWRKSVRRQLVSGVVLVYVAVMSVFVTTLVSRQRAFLQQKAESRTLLNASLLATSASPGVMSSDVSGLQEILQALRADQRILHAMVLDPQGRILAHTDASKAGLFLRDARSIELLKRPPAAQVISSTPDAVEAMAPVLLRDQMFGWVRVKRELSDDRQHLRALALWGIGFTSIAIVLGTAVTIAVAGAILRPLRLLLGGTERITQGGFDEPIPITTQNEVGVVTRAFNDAMAQLTRQIANRTQAEADLRAQAARIIEEAGQLTRAAENILTTATFLTSNATATAGAVSDTTSTVEEIRQTSHLAADQAKEVSQNAQEAAEISRSGQRAAEGAGEGMQRIRDQMASLTEIMQQLNDETQVIGEIIATVEELAETSNLLAVNAAIEAARAGENGKGFSVVAHEVKHLSNQSKQATARVRLILSEIQKATHSAVLATEHGLRVVDLGAGQSAEAAGSILKLSGSITQAAQRAAGIAVSTAEQLTGIQQVAIAMQAVRSVSAQNVNAAKDLEAAARNLSEMGQRLSGLVERSAVG